MNRRYALGKALQRSGRETTKALGRVVERRLTDVTKAVGRVRTVTATSAKRAVSNGLRGLDSDLAAMLLSSRQGARSGANGALAGLAIGVAVQAALQGDQERAKDFASSLADNVKAAVITTAVAWALGGGKGSLAKALRSDRSIPALVQRTGITESADAFNQQLRAIQARNGDRLHWVWDAHLEGCPACRARHGRPIAVTGYPPLHPHCQCFAAPLVSRSVTGTASGRSGRGRGPGVPYRPNPEGTIRTEADIVRLAREHGIDLDWDDEPIRLVVHPTPGDYANYARWPAPEKHLRVDPRKEMLTLPRTTRGQLVVKFDPETMKSDDAIVGTVAHEMHELKALVREFELRGGSISRADLDSLVDAERGRLHHAAYDHSDEIVRKRQARDP